MDALEAMLSVERPRLFFIQSVCHNPTGSDISPAKAHRLLQLAERHDLLLVEDDALADFKPSSALKVAALDQLRRSLYIGSFSKSVSAALRVGYIAGSKEAIDELADLQMMLHTSCSELCERTADVILSEGHFLRHLMRLTAGGLRVLDELGAEVFCRPEQSLYLWARFPGIEDTAVLTREVQGRGVMLAPGAIFQTNQKAVTPWTRLNVAYLQEPVFGQCIRP